MNALRKCVLRIISNASFSYPKNTAVGTKLYIKFYATISKNPFLPNPYSVKKLQEIFNIRESTASNIILDNKKFAAVSANEIAEAYRTCIDAGILKEHIQEHVEVLASFDIADKMKLLKTLPYDLNIIMPLLVVDEKILKKFVIQEMGEKRIKYLARLFDVINYSNCFGKYSFVCFF